MVGPFPGERYTPANGTEGVMFFDEWCSHCARDKAMREGVEVDECDDNEKCEIIAASFRGEHVEWRELEDGTVKCMAFVAAGEAIPAPRCEHTVDMFEAQA
jgi:hypothetical protein